MTIFYLDTSVLLRVLFDEPNRLDEFDEISSAVSSEILRVECLRSADRYRIRNDLSEGEYVVRVELIQKFLKGIELLKLSAEILGRASQSFPLSIGTLDALHLSTCLAYRDRHEDLVLCSHDESLKKAARAMGIEVKG